jgi:hypothetical protein
MNEGGRAAGGKEIMKKRTATVETVTAPLAKGTRVELLSSGKGGTAAGLVRTWGGVQGHCIVLDNGTKVVTAQLRVVDAAYRAPRYA